MISTKLPSILLFAMSALTVAASEESSLLTSVHSHTSDGYRRPRTDTGEFRREYYAISNGGAVGGSLQDHAVATVPFSDLVEPLGEYLARQNYYLAKNKEAADLLLVVHWGVTLSARRMPTREMRDWAAADNARLLGYGDILARENELRRLASGASNYQTFGEEVEEQRYYLVVSAYDFRSTVQAGQRRLLWITRVSIRSAGNSFAREFSTMLAKAAPYFGQDTGQLLRREEIDARVEIGELKILDSSLASPAPQATPQQSK